MSKSSIITTIPLGSQWPTLDPFMFCAYHKDDYPAGNENMGLDASQLAGRQIGSDFSAQKGWSMYHGDEVPGFPRHPHCGFETITIGRDGYIDHSDSLGATSRFGDGDVQWMTAGNGVVHCEMFPLVNEDAGNPLELFQIWLNLPAVDKKADPYFTMLWREEIPRVTYRDSAGKTTEIMVVAGSLEDTKALAPPPNSWASRDDANVGVWTMKMEAGASWTLPATREGTNRVLYFFVGDKLEVAGTSVDSGNGVQLDPRALTLVNGDQPAELLLLQGKPIGEPVVQHGPFVVNEQAELRQVFEKYQRGGFGGWPWDVDGPAHPRDQGRFAKHSDGQVETPGI